MAKITKEQQLVEKASNQIDYKNPEFLKKFLTNRYKILPKKLSRISAKTQRKLENEIKKARLMGLLPFTDRNAIN